MAYFKLCLFVFLCFVAQSLQDNPVVDFCRRWAHQTAIVAGRLYIDGGQVAYKNLAYNYTNEYLLFNDLQSRSDVGFPLQYSNSSKPANIPSVSGGYLWADEANKCFYQFGGEYSEGTSPKDFSMYTYDVILNQWNDTKYLSSERLWQRPSYGAGAQVESRGLGFYYGGWLSNRSTPGWKGPQMAQSSIIQFNFTTGNLRNSSHPDNIGRAEGQMVYLPVSDNGVLVYFGGIEDRYRNGSYAAVSLKGSNIHIYDINSGKWYNQTATGQVPLSRRQFCAGVTWPEDRSSFNIYLYGGYGFGTPAAFDDVYILSLPSFKWVKGYPLGGTDSNQFGHGGCSANVMNKNQMMVIGGWFPNPTFGDCDAPDAQGQHNMVMGNNSGKAENGIWDKYDPKLTTYAVPSLVVAVIGGGPTGGATVTAPATWDHNDLKVYYKLSPTAPTRAATRFIAGTATPSPTPTDSPLKKKNIGAIAGGTVGGLVILIAILSLILFCLHRHKKAKKEQSREVPAPPAELAVTHFPHEMSTTGARKYVSVHEQSHSNGHSTYSGLAPTHSRTASYDHHSPNSPSTPQIYSSPKDYRYAQASTSPPQSPNNAELFLPDDNAVYDAQRGSWVPQAGQPTQAPVKQQQYSYHTPTSPQQTSDFSPHEQYQSQVYYPPPQEQSRNPRYSPPSPIEQQSGSLAGTQYSSDTRHGNTPNMSTMTTPAQFYAQPVPTRNPAANDSGGYR
ncbi:hypothetical protein GQ44DRAFT_816576 [Phaeosphaeriaceae sp. PMI808]|nr:hypothetical protein GQ44DRAFT_816576 [Phaeosphaeriaceae sp. PMI808]